MTAVLTAHQPYHSHFVHGKQANHAFLSRSPRTRETSLHVFLSWILCRVWDGTVLLPQNEMRPCKKKRRSHLWRLQGNMTEIQQIFFYRNSMFWKWNYVKRLCSHTAAKYEKYVVMNCRSDKRTVWVFVIIIFPAWVPRVKHSFDLLLWRHPLPFSCVSSVELLTKKNDNSRSLRLSFVLLQITHYPSTL